MSESDLFTGKLVRLTAEDPEVVAKPYAQWAWDTEYSRMLDSSPPYTFSEKKWKEWMEKDLDKAHDYAFSIRSLDGNQLIGFVALFALHWQHGDTMVAIALGEREYWGKGYGTDAMNLMLRYVFTELNLRRVSLIVFEYNPRAIRSYEKAGFVEEGRIRGAMLRDGKRWDYIWMGVMRDEWMRLQETAGTTEVVTTSVV
jgi:RimJ/RimL family protein N-acetyltransferase